MTTHKGKPSGFDKSEGKEGTGIPSKVKSNVKRDKRLTKEYTDDDEKLADNVRTNNPNRNLDKDDATNIHGYRG
jgi:hypothetical protein